MGKDSCQQLSSLGFQG